MENLHGETTISEEQPWNQEICQRFFPGMGVHKQTCERNDSIKNCMPKILANFKRKQKFSKGFMALSKPSV